MTEPLSPAWAEEVRRKLAASAVGESGAPRLRLGLMVRAEDGSTTQFTAVLGGGEAGEFISGDGGAPDVVLVESAATAGRIAGGASIAEELAAGHVKIEGDVRRLIGADRELAALAAAFAED